VPVLPLLKKEKSEEKSDAPAKIQIFVKTRQGKTISLDANPRNIKTTVPAAEQVLIYTGKQLGRDARKTLLHEAMPIGGTSGSDDQRAAPRPPRRRHRGRRCTASWVRHFARGGVSRLRLLTVTDFTVHTKKLADQA
jgi:hypothetical protein